MTPLQPSTKEEQIALYLKCTKKQLAEMLYEANKRLDFQSVPLWYWSSEAKFFGADGKEITREQYLYP